MNLAVRRLLFFFFSISTLAACDDPNEIGLELQEGNQIGTEFTDTITINTGTVLLSDSVSSFKLGSSSVGYYVDPILGKLEATTYTEVGIGTSDFITRGNDPALTLDSLVLTLDYSFIYGNPSAALEVNVHELAKGQDNKGGFSSTASYFTNSTLPYNSAVIGSKTFVPTILKKEGTAIDSAAVLLNIKLDNNFAKNLLNQSGQETLTSQQKFNDFMRGIAITAETTTSANIVGFNLNSTASVMRLYYKVSGEAVQKVHNFPLSGAEVRNFYGIKADRSGYILAPLTRHGNFIPASATGNETYVQANTQLVTKLTFPYLNNFKQKFEQEKKNIIINRAELLLPVKPASNTIFPSHQSFVLYETNNTNLIKRNKDGVQVAVQQEGTYNLNSTNYPAPVEYIAKKGYYRLNMTSYIQGLIYADKPNTGLLLASGTAGLASGSQLSERQIIQEARQFRTVISNSPEKPVKLLIYYTKLN